MDIHGVALRLERLLHSISQDESIPPRSRRLLHSFWQQCTASGVGSGNYKYLHALRHLARFLKKPMDRATKEDIVRFLNEVERSHWSDWTKHGIKVALKKFYKWLRGTDVYPEEVRWFSATMRNANHKLPEELISEDEVRAMMERAENPRDRALVAVLYESGARVGEILGLRCKHVSFDDYGAIIIVNGKTGDRRIRLVAGAPTLAAWLDSHPTKAHDDYLWTTKFNRHEKDPYTQLGYAGVCRVIEELARRAGIKKRIHPHLFRHSRATALANKLTEAQLKQLFGWTQGSNMASVYVHLSGRDVDHALLALHGIKNEPQQGETFKVVTCPRCLERNDPVARYCKRCALVLDPALAKEDSRKSRLYEEITAQVLERDPEFAKQLVKRALKLGLEKKLKRLTA